MNKGGYNKKNISTENRRNRKIEENRKVCRK